MNATLTLYTLPPIELTRELLELGPARAALNGEVPSITVTLDNARGEAAALLSMPPLRARAVLTFDGVTVFDGRVQSITLADVAVLQLEQ